MESDRKATLPRQSSFSRRNSIMAPLMVSGRWRKLTCSVFFFSVGIFCGFIFSSMTASFPSSSFGRRPKSILHPAAERAARIAEAERVGVSMNAHTRRKDLSVQFRDYIPRQIFINCGGTFPDSVELFLETFPSSEKFVIFSFIPDISYAPLYSVYSSHTILSPTVCGTKNDSVAMGVTTITGDSRNISVPSIDIANWIQDNTHADEFIVFKIDSEPNLEKDIAERLAETSAVEWINKFYTTSEDDKIVKFYDKAFKIRNEKVKRWDNKRERYSDLEEVNPTRNPSTSRSVIKECGNAKTLKHPLFFYASKTTPSLNATLEVLKAFSDSRNKRISAALFLPFDAVKTYRLQLEAVHSRIDLGVYFNGSVKDGSQRAQRLVNKFVGAENCFGSVGLILHHVLAGRAVNSKIVEKLVKERHYNIFVKTIDIIPSGAELESTGVIAMPNITDYEIPVLDINQSGAERTVLYLLSRYESIITPLQECLEYTHKVD